MQIQTDNHAYLYVEDDALSREALEIILRRMMKVEHLAIFDDSRDFMARLKALSMKPDIILLDIHMEPLNGFDILALLRADADFINARIIALTASVMNEEVELLKRSGFDGVIGKPINVMSFPTLIERVVRGESIWHITD